MQWKVVFGLSLGIIAYLALGGVAFHLLESTHEEELRQVTGEYTKKFLDEKTCLNGEELELLITHVIEVYNSGVLPTNATTPPVWDFFSSLFFSTTVITTIGYGNISPSTQGGRVFFVFYAMFGIPLCLALLAGWGDKLKKAAETLDKKLNNNRCPERPAVGKGLRASFIVTLGLLLFCFIPAIIFSLIEGWSYGTALYYVFVTLSTIGFGDYVPARSFESGERGLYKLLVGVWVFLGLAWLATIIAFVQEVLEKSIQKMTSTNPQSQKPEESSKNGLSNSKQSLNEIQTVKL